MPKVPTLKIGGTQQAVAGSRGVSERVNTNVSSEDFGAAEARGIQQLGGAIRGAADAITNVAAQQSLATTRDQVNKGTAFLLGKKQEYSSKQGGEVIGITTSFFEDANKYREKATKNMNDREAELFKASFDSTTKSYAESLSGYERKGTIEYNNETKSAQNSLAIQSAVAGYQDPALVRESEETIRANLASTYAPMGKDVSEIKVAEGVNALYTSMLAESLRSSPTEALTYLGKYWDKLNPLTREALKQSITEKSKVERGTYRASILASSGVKIEEQLKLIDDIKDPAIKDAARKEAITLDKQKKLIDKEAEITLKNEVADMLVKDINTPIPADRLSPEAYKFLLSFKQSLQSGENRTNFTPEGKDLYLKVTDPNISKVELENIDLTPGMNQMPMKQYQEIRDIQAGVKGGERVMTPTRYASEAAKEVAGAKKGNQDERLAYMTVFANELKGYSSSEQKDPKIWRSIKDDLNLKVISNEFDVSTLIFGSWGASTKWEAINAGEKGVRPIGVPEELKEKGIRENDWVSFDHEGQLIEGWQQERADGDFIVYQKEGGKYVRYLFGEDKDTEVANK